MARLLGLCCRDVVVVMLAAAPASAQRWGMGGWRGYGYGIDLGQPYYGQGYYNNWGYLNNYPGYSSNWYNPGWRSGWMTTYPSYYSGWNYAPNRVYGWQPSNYAVSTVQNDQRYTSFYSGDRAYDDAVPAKAALISVSMAPDAKITFSGHETKQQGSFREFVTPVLADNDTYSYDLRMQWTENGQNIDRTRKILVHAGDRIHLDIGRDGMMVHQVTPAPTAVRHQSGYDSDMNREKLNGEKIQAPQDQNNQNQNNQNQNNQNNDRNNQNNGEPRQPIPQAPNGSNDPQQGGVPRTNSPTAPPTTVK